MSSPSRKNGASTGRVPPVEHQFKPGNPGRPKGARNQVTLAVEALLDGQAEALTQTAINAALGGDMTALRLCLDRIAPPRKGRPVTFTMPAIETAADVAKALGSVVEHVASGDLTPDEAAAVSALLEAKRRAIETVEIEARVAALEGKA